MGASEQATAGADYAAIQEYLFGLKAGGVRFGVDRMRLLASEIGHPEAKVPCIHVAGTNGKGSVAAMLEAILSRCGWKVGLYTSPHLVRLGERIQVGRAPLTQDRIMAYANELAPVVRRLERTHGDDRPSFFEMMTAMAFLHFEREGCDISVIEVGLGGRLDATNIVFPEVSVITSIGLDHCEILGDTLEKIAFEKAGIIKPGHPVVVGRMPEQAEAAIRSVARERGSALQSVQKDWEGRGLPYPSTRLHGAFQRWNAATAALTCGVLGRRWNVGAEQVAQGLAAVDWPGRWQRMEVGGRLVVLDATHNPEGAPHLGRHLDELRAETGAPPVLVVGCLGEARARAVLEQAAPRAAAIHLVVPQQSRACSHEQLEALLPPGTESLARRARVEDLFPEPGRCRAEPARGAVVVTGSIYLMGEVLSRLEPDRGQAESRLQDF